LDHVSSPTGLVDADRGDGSRVAGARRRHLVDGAHAPGMLAFRLGDIGAAYYTGIAQVGVRAEGAGFLHVRRDRQAAIRPWTSATCQLTAA